MRRPRFIGITQGGCGIISHEAAEGLFTGGLESCLAIAYECENGCVLFHDSGQLRVSEVCELVKGLGEVRRIHAAFGMHVNGELHQSRLDKIISALDYAGSVEVLQVNRSRFSVCYTESHGLKLADALDEEGVVWPENSRKREAINILRDLFIEPGSQQLGIDVQYSGGMFTGTPALNPPLHEILEMVACQKDFFLLNLKALHKFALEGEIALPVWLMNFYDEFDIESLDIRTASAGEVDVERNIFEEYKALHASQAVERS